MEGSHRKNSLTSPRRNSVILTPKAIDLDDILVKELGQFGRFQCSNLFLLSIPLIMSAFMSEYVFSAAAISHRCYIPECDGENPEYQASWIYNAVPKVDGSFSNCYRYKSRPGYNSSEFCSADQFSSTLIKCESYVYEKTNSVVYDFGLECQEWLRALAGMLSSLGNLLVLPFIGYISDNYGRKLALVISVFNFGLFGLVRAFSTSYGMYLAFQLLQTTLGGGIFTSAYILAVEFVGPKYRPVTGATTSAMFAIGQIIMGYVAWVVQPWRYMIIALHAPCLFIVGYYLILSESVRWLISMSRYEEAIKVLKTVAKVNKKRIEEDSLNSLLNPPPQKALDPNQPGLFKTVFKSRVLFRRICTTPIWWITSTFIYYGLSINSTGLSGNMYLNYIVVCAIELPGNYLSVFIINKIGRKPTLTFGFFLSAACNLAFIFTPVTYDTTRLILYITGKFGIAIVFPSLYLYTLELYPTAYRHSFLGFSSMVGRIGAIVAPLTPALTIYWSGLPSLLFGCFGLLSGVLILTQPETLGAKLPDTLEEAETLGR